jgi:hypothetical protein
MAGLSGPSRIGLVSLITLIRVLVPTSPPSPPRLECPALTQRGPLVRYSEPPLDRARLAANNKCLAAKNKCSPSRGLTRCQKLANPTLRLANFAAKLLK